MLGSDLADVTGLIGGRKPLDADVGDADAYDIMGSEAELRNDLGRESLKSLNALGLLFDGLNL